MIFVTLHGRLDGFYEWQLNAWDVVAGQAIVEAAGGTPRF